MPRAWQLVGDVLAKTPPTLLHHVIAGCVGEGVAAEFIGFLRLYRELPVTRSTYDALGRKVAVASSDGQYYATSMATYLCDSVGNLVAQTAVLASGVLREHATTTEFAYDSLTRLTDKYEAVNTARARNTHLEYDSARNITETTTGQAQPP